MKLSLYIRVHVIKCEFMKHCNDVNLTLMTYKIKLLSSQMENLTFFMEKQKSKKFLITFNFITNLLED